MTPPRRVSSHLRVAVEGPVLVELQVAVDAAPDALTESLSVTSEGRPVEVREVRVPGVGRVHVCRPPVGLLDVDYQATVTASEPAQVEESQLIVYRRPSRYAESDRLVPIADAAFGGIADPADLLAAVSSWVGSRLRYVPGSSGPTEGAVDTMLKREGVCRDYAHLVVALLRALDVPARVVAVYAPGLYPMDFHAVAEVAVGGQWCVVDASLLAPRRSLVRIASGRDAADTAFLSTYGASAVLLESAVTAIVDGPLPDDDVVELVGLT